jgi:peptide/nickel transport system substrate-binding protein
VNTRRVATRLVFTQGVKEMRAGRLSRRRTLLVGVTSFGALAAAVACAPQTPAPSAEPAATPAGQAGQAGQAGAPTTAAGAAPGKYKESPDLAAQVKDGKLPPVEQRLPKEPMVITPIDKVGAYGGTWRTGTLGPSDNPWFDRTLGYESLVRWDVDWKNMVPDIAKKYEVSPDGKSFTFYLREGMKWSDGKPFTADDIVFSIQDVLLNKDITPAVPAWFVTAGKPGRVEKLDQYSFRLSFDLPNGTLLKRMCMNGAGNWIIQAEYGKKFHAAYSKDAVDKLVADQKLPGWGDLFNKMTGNAPGTGYAGWYNTELPVLHPWMIATGLGQGPRAVAKRNPYFWKVDPSGNQLPYLDEVVYDVVEKVDTLTLKALNGEIEMMDRHVNTPANKSVFIDNKAKANLDLFTEIPDSMNTFTVLFNFNHKDPVLRDIIQNINFRIALSLAVNRKELIDLVYFGQGEPWQAAPLKQSPYYHERLASQYLDYDVAKANQMLDQIGLDKKGPDGIRLRPDGKPLSMTWEVSNTSQQWIDTAEQFKKYWGAVGVDIGVKSEERGLRQQRVTTADHDVTNWGGDGGIDAILGPYWYMAFASFNSHATQWALWYESNGAKGEEPSEPAKKQMELYEQVKTTAEDAKQKELMKQLLDIAADQFWIMGVSTPGESYGIVKNNFKNVPKQMYASGQEYSNPGASMPEQYFMQK